MSEFEEGERSRKLAAQEQSTQPTKPKGIPFTFLTENQAGKTEERKGEAYSPEVYLRVVDNLQQIVQESMERQETSEQERGVENSLLMVNLGLQAIAYDHLGPKGQADFKDELFSLIRSQKDWAVQPISETMRLYKNSFELTQTQGKLLQRIAEGLNLTYDPGEKEYHILKRTFFYDHLLHRPITKHKDDLVEYKPHYDTEIKAYLQAKEK